MCSRYSFTSPSEAVRQLFKYHNLPNFPPRKNIAPTQPVGIVRRGLDDQREFHLVRWGLVPGWAKDPDAFTTLINARSETVFEKPSFKSAITYRRCIVPADGFYEWTGERGRKVPHHIHQRDGGVMGFAGVWETWLGKDGSEFDSMAILTTEANGTMEPIHSRMPVILRPDDFDAWLNMRETTKDEVAAMLQPAPNDLLAIEPVTWSLSHKKAADDVADVEPPEQGWLL